MNRLFVAYKPPFVPSNSYLSRLKRKYGQKKAGFSGTLDPFACGTLVIAFGAYTKLFRFLKKYPKVYRTTIWLGARSPSLDIERVKDIKDIPKIPIQKIQDLLESFKGDFTYTPPIFSAKRVGGKRAYQAAHKGEPLTLSPITSKIYDIRLINYSHPFLTIEATVSEGTYIRSLGEYIAQSLGTTGSLSYLERLREGAFVYEEERPLDVTDYLITEQNQTLLPPEAIWHGKKLWPKDLTKTKEGLYHLLFDKFFAIIEIKDQKVRYLLNQIPRISQ